MAFLILVELGLLALSLAGTYLLAPSSASSKPSGIGSIPRAEEGAAIPLVYGTCRIRSPLVVAVGDAHPSPLDYMTGGQTVGYDYEVGVRMVLCAGNVPHGVTTGGAQLVGIYSNDHRIEGMDVSSYPATTGNSVFGVYDSTMFAEVVGSLNGAIGTAILYSGRWDQVVNDVADVIDDFEQTELDLGTDRRIPYRGQVVLSLRGTSVGGWRTGGATMLPAIHPVIHNPITIPGYEAQTGAIGDGDANPAAILYDLLTNPWGRLGGDTATVDVDSFVAAAETLADEGLGLSLYLADARLGREHIAEVLKHIDAVMYEDPATGKQVLRLMRADYVVGDVFVADASNIVDIELTGTLWGETANEVIVNYTDANRDWTPGTEQATNPANINSQGGRRRTVVYNCPGITTRAMAAKLAIRELALASLPLMRARIVVNRGGWALRPGDAIRVNYAPWSVDATFRVTSPDTGTLQDGSVSFIAIQDRFSVTQTSFEIPFPVPELPPTPAPIVERVITEAPRWVQQKGLEQGYLSSVDAQHGYYLAAPPTSQESRYRVMLDASADSPARAFPGRFTLATAYARDAGPFDGTVGIEIQNVAGWTPTTTTDAMIAAEGANLILIDDELIAFRTATDTGGATYTLTNVWRGVLDTVPAAHAVDAQGYALPGRFALGSLGSGVLTHGTVYDALTLSAVGSSWTPDTVAPADTLTATSRTLRPYPADAVEVNGSQTPAALTEEGVTIEGTARDRLRGAITRPDAGAESVESGTVYHAVAYGDGETPLDDGVQVEIGTGSYDDTEIAIGVGPLPVGAAGHGAIEVGLETRRAVTLPDATAATLTSWQPATVPITAHHYRNLLINPRFAVSGQAWTFTTGTPTYATGSAGLGGGGSYLTTSSATLDGYQDVPISGYRPGGYTALLRFAIGPTTADADDTVSVVVTARDASGSTLATATYSAAPPSTWQWQTLTLADLDPDTVTIRVRVILAAVGELDTAANVAITECRLQVGQLTSQLLANPSFESGFASWTQSTGTWQQMTSPIYGSANWARPNNGASAQLYQDVTPTAGWEASGVAVLELGRINDDASDTGTVTITARDGGGSTLATATTGAEEISPANVWQRRILFLELPAGTATVRVTLDAARVAGTPLNVGFDDLDLRIHKHLASDEELVADFSSARHTQPLPGDRFEWVRDFGTCPIPNHAILTGGTVGALGTEPLVESTGGAFTGARVVIDQGVGGMTASGYEIPGVDTGDVDDAIRVAPVGSSFANFGAAFDWAGLLVARWNVVTPPGTTMALATRYASGVGWRLEINSSGVPALRVEDLSGAAVATATDAVTHGDWFAIGFHFAASTGMLSIVDRSGVTTVDIASFAVADWLQSDAIRFQLLSGGGLAVTPGQVARCYLWRSTAPTTTQIAALITTHVRPSAWGSITSYPRTQVIAAVTGSDATGVLVERFSAGRVATGGTAEAPSYRGLLTERSITASTSTFSGWASAGGTIADLVEADPTGYRVACSINGTNSQGRYVAKTLGSAGTIYVRIMARASAVGTALVSLDDSSGTSQVTAAISVGATWDVYTVALAWTGATSGNGRVRICGSNDGTAHTVYLSPLVYVGSDHPGVGWMLVGTASACYATIDASALTVRANGEGEIVVACADGGGGITAGTIARLHNGTNSNDARVIAATSTTDTTGAVLDSGGSGSTIAVFNDDQPIGSGTTARLRWNRAGLPDHASSYAYVDRDGLGSPYGADVRTATWTASTTVLDALDLGHSGGASPWSGAIASVTIRAREWKS